MKDSREQLINKLILDILTRKYGPKVGALIYKKYGHQLNGAGFFDSVKGFFQRAKEKMFFPTNNYTASTQAVIDKYANEIIEAAQIRRAPIYSSIDTALNLITFGAFNRAKKEMNYDKMFHLSLLLRFRGSPTFNVKIEKNLKINITEDVRAMPNTEILNVVPWRGEIRFKEFLDRTLLMVSPERYYSYNSFSRNCQVFIDDLLTANGNINPEVRAFIKQDAEGLLKKLPGYTNAVSSFFTDLGTKFQELTGQGREDENDEMSKGIPKLKLTKEEKQIIRQTPPNKRYAELIFKHGIYRPFYDSKTPKSKKYSVIIYNKKIKKYARINFGARNMEHYKDLVSDRYAHLNHLDKNRRRLYRARASKIVDKNGHLTYKNKTSPNYYAYFFLW